ncbi:MAG TPA: AAA family ATPase [Methylomirabilota bacterium]|jgi:general secretion pathway protein A
MYLAHFGLRERPFSNTPDTRFVYLGARHEEALAHLLYGVQEHSGFVQLTGEIGTGKTTICRLLLNRLPEGVDVALILNPMLTPEELLAAICDELGAKYEGPAPSRKVLVDALCRHLLAAHAEKRRTVLIVDEAQHLSVGTLEQLRLLTNLETEEQKLLQIILIGQPELVDSLARKELHQLSQRIAARYHLLPLAASDTPAYVRHRLALAGSSREIFDAGALRAVHRLSGGVPRLINAICDRALLGAYAEGQSKVDRRTVRAAAREVLPKDINPRRVPWRLVTAAGALLVLAIGAGIVALGGPAMRPRPSAQRATTSAVEVGRTSPAPDAAPVAAREVPPVSVPRPSPPPALSEVLRSADLTADRASAFTSVFSRWRVEPRGWSDPCEAAASMGLGCVQAAGGWPKVRRLDLPAVLKLAAPDGKPHWAALVGFEADKASLAFGQRVVRVATNEIDGVWDGTFEVLWQPPPIGTRELTPGTRGRPVTWLKHRLDALDGQPPGGRDDAYDDALKARVLAFQRDQSLAVDGIAGVETLARLSSLTDQRIPSLSRAGR